MVVIIGASYVVLFINPSEALSRLYRGRLLQLKAYFAVYITLYYIVLGSARLSTTISTSFQMFAKYQDYCTVPYNFLRNFVQFHERRQMMRNHQMMGFQT